MVLNMHALNKPQLGKNEVEAPDSSEDQISCLFIPLLRVGDSGRMSGALAAGSGPKKGPCKSRGVEPQGFSVG